MKNIYVSTNCDDASVSVCICDDSGTHYPCPICGKHYDDELDALMCCMTDNN